MRQNNGNILQHSEPVLDASWMETLKFNYIFYCEITDFDTTDINTFKHIEFDAVALKTMIFNTFFIT